MPSDDNKRYNMIFSQELWNDVQQTSEELDITVAEFLRRSSKLGVYAAELEKTPGDGLISRRKGKDKKLRVFPRRRHEDDDIIYFE